MDPYYLTHKAQEIGFHPEMILAGRRLNDSMANYVAGQVVKLMAGKKILAKGSRVLVLGLTFKENCPDLRNSKVADVVRELKNYGAEGRRVRSVDRSRRSRARIRHSSGQAGARRRLRCGGAGRRPQGIPRPGHRQRAQGLQEESRGLRHQVRVPAPTRSTAGCKEQRVKILLTGAAGFIGFHTSRRSCWRAATKLSASTTSTTTTTRTSSARASPSSSGEPKFRFVKMDLADKGGMKSLFAREKFPRVIHLAAQAGVRYSLENPQAYIDSNVTGTLNVLEGCRHNGAEHLVFASTSSVYGLNTNMPFSVHRGVDHPLSLYASTKRANELMAHNYAALFKLPVTGLRFFTVYGPWGRPDMALFLFTKNILEGKPIDVFNHGHHKRDFTFVEDIAEGVVRACDRIAAPNAELDGRQPGSGHAAARRSASTTSATTRRST